MINAAKILIWNREDKRQLRRHLWMGKNIKIDLKKIGLYAANWINVAQDMDRWRAFVKTVMYFRIPQKQAQRLLDKKCILLSRKRQSYLPKIM
jgi:hypothetical protein